MKLLFKHELPRKLRYAKVYMELANASFFFSLDGSRASMYGSIGGRGMGRVSLSDADYSRLRASHRVVDVLDYDDERVVVRTEDGYDEEWVRPKWVLAGVRKSRPAHGVR